MLRSSHRLIVVYRALALLLIPALFAASGVASLLHTHAYDDHDHPEHRHGLSAHQHDAAPVHPDDGVAHLEACDPGKHAVSFAFVSATPPHVHAGDAEIVLPSSPVPESGIETAIEQMDVRVHGPPSRAQASPRAPPLFACT